jgi:transposase
MKTYRPYQPRQGFLLPQSPLEWLPEEHLAYFILETVAQLDLSAIAAHYERERRGYPPHDPQMMVALLLYAYCVGIPSSRKIEQRTHEDIAFRILAGNTHPDHSCISEFRRIHLPALSALFVQVLRLCERMGLVKLGVVALDGTKLRASASKHKAMSAARMKQEQERLEQRVKELLAAAEQADSHEDAQYGKSHRGDKLPEELRRAQSRLERIRATYAELQAEAAAQREERQNAQTEDAQTESVLDEIKRIKAAQNLPCATETPPDPEDDPPSPPTPSPLPVHQIPVDKKGEVKDSAQRNFTDADSRIQKDKSGFVQGYNGQFVVDGEAQIIVAHGLSNQAPDAEYFIPMLDRTLTNCGRRPDATLADAGYFSDANICRAEARGLSVYVAPARTPHGLKEPPPDEDPPSVQTQKERMQRKLRSEEGDALYRRRKTIVEPVIGQVKARGFDRLSLRGHDKASGEWALIGLTHNLLKLHKARRRRPKAPQPGLPTAPRPLGSAFRARAARPFLISNRPSFRPTVPTVG